MSDCNTFEGLHRASTVGSLDATSQATFDAHLASCPACVGRLQNYVLVTEVLKRLDPYEREIETPLPLAEGVVQRILATRKAATQARKDRKTG
jgi:anti-sigma factor RsiW